MVRTLRTEKLVELVAAASVGIAASAVDTIISA
jgi:hypothetical protein